VRRVGVAIVGLGALIALVGCQGRRRDGDGAGGSATVETAADSASGSGGGGFGSSADPVNAGSGGGGSGVGSGAGLEGPDPTRKVAVDEPESPPDPNKQIAELGAIPAWQAVVDRAQYLARRGQKGVVYGRIGPAVVLPAPPAPPAPPPATGSGSAVGSGSGSAVGSGSGSAAAPALSPYVWLVDDSEGNGSLGVRLALGKLQAKEGDRIAASGAWVLDDERHWYWKAEAIQPLAPPPASEPKDPPAAVPSHIPAGGGLPPNARPIKGAKDNELVYFQLVGPTPARDGDGWLIANQLGDLPVALLVLPGERPSYGGQDMRAPDERWQLKLRTLYVVRIGKLRSQGAGKPFLVNARTGPIRVQ
jgi:cell division septation protein DedD